MTTSIDSTGFHRDRLDVLLAALTAELQGIHGTDIDLTPGSVDAQWMSAFMERVDDITQLAEAVYNGRSPAGAVGAGLSRLVQLNGIARKGAQFSTAPVTLSGTPGTVIPINSLIGGTVVDAFSNAKPTFKTTTALTIGGGGTVSGTAISTTAGPVAAALGTLTLPLTVISGWTSVTNPSDATRGSLDETDPQLRTRRTASVALPSQSILDGLVAAIGQVANVEHLAVYENPEDTVDANGLPPHSINAIVDGGAPADIAQQIWLKKSVGVTQVGAQVQTVVDSQGFNQIMKFDRPGDANVYVILDLSSAVGAPTQSAIKDAIVAWGESTNVDGTPNSNYTIGTDIIWSQIFVPINKIPGLSVVSLKIGLAPSPTLQANVIIPFNAISRWDQSRITITP